MGILDTQYLRKSRKLAYQRKKLDEEKKKTVKNKTEKEFERNLKIDEIQEVKKKKKVKLGESVKTFHQRKVLKLYIKNFTSFTSKKQPSRVVLIKRFSENMQQIYSRTSMLKCDSNKVAKQLF